MGTDKVKEAEKKSLSLIARLGIKLKVLRTPTSILLEDGRRYNLPPHNEKEWFSRYVRHLIEEREMSLSGISKITKESYANLRYEQALAGSVDCSGPGYSLSLTGHVKNDNAMKVYQAALRNYDKLRADMK